VAAREDEVRGEGGGVAPRISGRGFRVFPPPVAFVFVFVLQVPDPEDVADSVLVNSEPGLSHQPFHVLARLDVLAAEEEAGDGGGRVGGEGGEVLYLFQRSKRENSTRG
jgi:hypothetical protein